MRLLSQLRPWRSRALAYLRGSRLRRYVPRALADAVVEGRVPTGTRELTVLFVDIRGYTAYAEHQAPDRIFAVISRYTRLTSEIVHAHGGWIADYSGDGLMAIFGCPTSIAHKERAGVSCGYALLGAFEHEIGVGIATGPVYVGTIECHDHVVWSATGNPTILAARLQAATRTLGASLAMDATTFARAGDCGRNLVKLSNLEIRGRQRVEDVFVVPLPLSGCRRCQ